MRLSMARSYGTSAREVERQGECFVHMLVLGMALMAAGPACAQSQAAAEAKPIKMVVLGDSLSAGLGPRGIRAFPQQLQKSLKSQGDGGRYHQRRGFPATPVPAARDRLDWSVPEGTEAVIVELGANDALRGTDPAVTRAALSDILTRLKARKIAVLFVRHGCAAELRQQTIRPRFNAIYPDLAKSFGVPLYPFLPGGRRRGRNGSIRRMACTRPRRAST